MNTVVKSLSTWRGWLHGLVAMVVGGAASAGFNFLSMNAAHAAGADVPVLNLKALGVILFSSGLVNAFAYLKQSPLPSDENPTT